MELLSSKTLPIHKAFHYERLSKQSWQIWKSFNGFTLKLSWTHLLHFSSDYKYETNIPRVYKNSAPQSHHAQPFNSARTNRLQHCSKLCCITTNYVPRATVHGSPASVRRHLRNHGKYESLYTAVLRSLHCSTHVCPGRPTVVGWN